MSVIVWDKVGERFYETGVKNGVLYPYDSSKTMYGPGVPWNGLSAVTESPSGADATPIYADDFKYLNLIAAEEFGATVEAYTYPDEFAECDGSVSIIDGVTIGQQSRKMFGLSYRTVYGNDTEGENYGYKIHLIYGCKAAPTDRAYQTINDSPEAISFSWEISTTPVDVTINGVAYKPTAHMCIDSRTVGKEKMAKIEAALYGTTDEDPYLPLPSEIYDLLTAA